MKQCRCLQHPINIDDLFKDLRLRQGTLQTAFNCCNNQGGILDYEQTSYRLCPLGQRLSTASKVIRQFESTWEADFPSLIVRPDKDIENFITAHFNKNSLDLGEVFTSQKAPNPSFWLLILASVWHYGIQPHVVNLEKTPVEALLPPTSHDRLYVFIEHKQATLTPKQTLDLTALISHCYRSMQPVWLDLQGSPPPETKQKTSFQTMINRHRRKNPLTLPTHIESKMKEICRFNFA